MTSDQGRVEKEACKATGDAILQSWFEDKKYIPAEALTFLGWNSKDACIDSKLEINGVLGDRVMRMSCCALLFIQAQTIIKDIITWMYKCSLYIAEDPPIAFLIRAYTKSEQPFRTFDPTKLKTFKADVVEGRAVIPSFPGNVYRQDKLCAAVYGAPEIDFNAIFKHRDAPPEKDAFITPYVYVYRGIRDMANIQDTYNSPDCSSWTFDADVALRFARGLGKKSMLLSLASAFFGSRKPGILRMRLTPHIAALNLHCLPFQNFGPVHPCKAVVSDDERRHWREKAAEQKSRLKIGDIPVEAGHVSAFDAEFEVLVEPLIIPNVTLVLPSLKLEGVPFYEGGEPWRLKRTTEQNGGTVTVQFQIKKETSWVPKVRPEATRLHNLTKLVTDTILGRYKGHRDLEQDINIPRHPRERSPSLRTFRTS
jgi:hypothetical protein